MTYHRSPLRPRLAGELVLTSRQATAKLAERHPDQVRRHCCPIACDVDSRQPLYDADECIRKLASLRRVA